MGRMCVVCREMLIVVICCLTMQYSQFVIVQTPDSTHFFIMTRVKQFGYEVDEGKVSHCSQAALILTKIAQVALDLIVILLPQTPMCWNYRHEPAHQ